MSKEEALQSPTLAKVQSLPVPKTIPPPMVRRPSTVSLTAPPDEEIFSPTYTLDVGMSFTIELSGIAGNRENL